MMRTTATIRNKLGLHARASAKLTKLAGSFQCEVYMARNGRRINAKSIMGVMMLAAGMGSEVELETDGADEQAAMAALLALISDKIRRGPVAQGSPRLLASGLHWGLHRLLVCTGRPTMRADKVKA